MWYEAFINVSKIAPDFIECDYLSGILELFGKGIRQLSYSYRIARLYIIDAAIY